MRSRKRRLSAVTGLLLAAVVSLSGPLQITAAETNAQSIDLEEFWKERTEGQEGENTPTPAPQTPDDKQTTPAPQTPDDTQPTPAPQTPDDPQPTPIPGDTGTDDHVISTEPQVTYDDLERMNNGQEIVLFSDEGYLIFLFGKYYDKQVHDQEEAIASLQCMAGLLGLSKGSEFYSVFGMQDPLGYTYYIYQQRYGDITLQNAVLKVIVDPEGYPCGLVSSFTPNIGIAPDDEPLVTADEALEIVKKRYQGTAITFYPEATRQTSVTFHNVAYHAWAVFSSHPAETRPTEGPAYLEHLVSYDGLYLYSMAVRSPEEMVLGDNIPGELAAAWFDGKEAGTYTGEVTLCDGTKETITVPVVWDPEQNTYILADPERKILVADHKTFRDRLELKTITSPDNTGWPEHYLKTYNTYIKVYDFFDSHNFHSVDGFGVPILILYDFVDDMDLPYDNACYLGRADGWACFGASAINDYGEALDVIGHEFTHGITEWAMGGQLYENESGALNEALSDILGNLCEMISGETDDTEWLIGEKSGRKLRSMSFPWKYKNPGMIGDEFYIPVQERPSYYDDYGGVHTNSSLVNLIAWNLCARGMSLEDAFTLWVETIHLLSPTSGFREVHAALAAASEILGLDITVEGQIHMICQQMGF